MQARAGKLLKAMEKVLSKHTIEMASLEKKLVNQQNE
jgi:Holliday junction resolvasome RuvABC endonuclease subunit